MPDNFTAEQCAAVLKSASLEEAKMKLLEILDSCTSSRTEHPMKNTKVVALRENIKKLRSVKDAGLLAYNMLLSGERLSSLDSRYQAKHND